MNLMNLLNGYSGKITLKYKVDYLKLLYKCKEENKKHISE